MVSNRTPRVSWCIALAFGLSFAPLTPKAQDTALPSQPIPAPGNEQSRPAGNDSASGDQRGASPLVSAIQGVEAAIRDVIPQEDQEQRRSEEGRDQADLEAQQDMAFWAQWMFWVNTGTTLLTFVGLFLIWRTLTATKSAAKAAWCGVEEARGATQAAIRAAEAAGDAVAAERAWLTMATINTQFHKDLRIGNAGHEKALALTVQWLNSGRSPANNTRITCHGAVIAHDDDIPTFSEEPNDDFSFVIGPGMDVESMTFYITGADLDAFMSKSRKAIVYSKALYFDVFNKATERVSESCASVEYSGARIGRNGESSPNFSIFAVGRQNTTS